MRKIKPWGMLAIKEGKRTSEQLMVITKCGVEEAKGGNWLFVASR